MGYWLACHIPDRQSRGTNRIWPDLAFGFAHPRDLGTRLVCLFQGLHSGQGSYLGCYTLFNWVRVAPAILPYFFFWPFYNLFIYFPLTLRVFHAPHFLHSAFSALRIFHTPHIPHSSFSTLRIFYTPIFHTPYFPHSAYSTLPFSTLLIFYTPHFLHSHFPHSAYSTLRVFYTPHFLHSSFSTLRTPPPRLSPGQLSKKELEVKNLLYSGFFLQKPRR